MNTIKNTKPQNDPEAIVPELMKELDKYFRDFLATYVDIAHHDQMNALLLLRTGLRPATFVSYLGDVIVEPHCIDESEHCYLVRLPIVMRPSVSELKLILEAFEYFCIDTEQSFIMVGKDSYQIGDEKSEGSVVFDNNEILICLRTWGAEPINFHPGSIEAMVHEDGGYTRH